MTTIEIAENSENAMPNHEESETAQATPSNDGITMRQDLRP